MVQFDDYPLDTTDGGPAGGGIGGGVGGTGGLAGTGTGGDAGEGGANGGNGGTGGTGATGGGTGATGTGATGGATGGTGATGAGATGGTGATGGNCLGTAGPTMVEAGGYCIDSTEVTNAHYAAFLAAGYPTTGQDAWCAFNTTYAPSNQWPAAAGKEAHPVGWVDWCDAYAYCKWAGKRLCGKIGGGTNLYAEPSDATKSQWYAACSAGGSETYPYGGSYQGTACKGSDYGGFQESVAVESAVGCVGGYPGIYDMSGNVYEWEDSCDGTTGSNDHCRVRGGYFASPSTELTCSFAHNFFRWGPSQTLGFRCCGP